MACTKWLINAQNHFKTPAQSPDLNPIELVWNDLKFYIGKYVKPNTMFVKFASLPLLTLPNTFTFSRFKVFSLKNSTNKSAEKFL